MNKEQINQELHRRVYGEWPADKCPVCGWPYNEGGINGCREDNCALRPVPERRADAPRDFFTDWEASLDLVRWICEPDGNPRHVDFDYYLYEAVSKGQYRAKIAYLLATPEQVTRAAVVALKLF